MNFKGLPLFEDLFEERLCFKASSIVRDQWNLKPGVRLCQFDKPLVNSFESISFTLLQLEPFTLVMFN